MATTIKPKPVAMAAPPPPKTKAELRRQQASAANAKKAFTNFTTGKSAAQQKARNYVGIKQNVQARQREVINQQLEDLKPAGPGLTLIANPDDLQLDNGQLELSVLITAMEKAKNGFVFYTDGSTLTEQINIQNQADAIIANIKKGGQNNG